jgi:hypothetical protein
MAEPQVMSAQEYGRTVLGYAPNQTIQGKELAKFRDQYARYVQTASKSFTPTTGMMTNEVSGTVTPYFMSSPNSAQIMAEKQATMKMVPGKDGKAYAFDPLTGTVAPVTVKGSTNQFEMDPKANRMQELMDALGGAAAEEEEAPGILASIFGGAKATPAPTPSPSPMATPAPAMAGTDTPQAAFGSVDEVMAAARAGRITLEDAQNILVSQFNLDP